MVVQHTTQHGMRSITNSTLAQRFCIINQMLCNRHLHHTMYTDTMFVSTLSWHANTCTQIYRSNFRWLQTYLMKTKGKPHDTMSLMIQYLGVPPLVVMNSSKEQTPGIFCQKLRDCGCEKKITEPYFPLLNEPSKK